MTGFGRGESVSEDCKVTVEIKAVNHRYCDLNMKLPRKLNYLEADIRSFLKQSIQRGKVDVFINYEDLSAKDVNVRLNEELGKEYYAALTKLGETLGISSDVTALQIGRFPDVLSLEDVAVNQESIKEQLMKALSEAAGHFSDSREKEGENLKTDILAKLEGMKENVAFIEERYPSIVSEYRKKLEDKVAELLGDTNVDENRIAAEVVIYSDKICVDEETVRLRSHLSQLEDMLEKFLNDDVPVGDIPPDVHPRFGQVDEAVGLIVHIAHAFQRLQRAGDGGAGHARRLRDGTGAGRAFPDFLMEDDF